MRKCSTCKEEKPLTSFNIQKSKYNTGQLHHYCKNCIQKRDRERYEKNKEKLKNQAKQYRQNNKQAVRDTQKKYRDTQKNNLFFKLRHSVGSLTRNAYKAKHHQKDSKTVELLGCSYADFVTHIESQFEPWMNSKNYGMCIPGCSNIGWDIDHIIPLASASSLEELKSLCHYKNLRPLCSNYNRYVKNKNIENE